MLILIKIIKFICYYNKILVLINFLMNIVNLKMFKINYYIRKFKIFWIFLIYRWKKFDGVFFKFDVNFKIVYDIFDRAVRLMEVFVGD